MNWVLLSLLAPLFWVFSNFIDKYILGKYSKGVFDFLFFSVIMFFPFFLGSLFFIGLPEFTVYSWIPIVTGMGLIYSYVFYAKAISQGDTSVLVILFSLGPLLTLILAFIFLNQALSTNEIMGFIMVLIGALIVSLEKLRRKVIFTKGLGMILIAIPIWSALTILIDYALTKVSFWDFFLLDNFGSLLAGPTFLILPSMRRRVLEGLRTSGKRKYLWFLGNNALDFFGQMISKKALSIASSAGLVAVIMQVQSFYAIVIGFLLTIFMPGIIKEDISFGTLFKKTAGAVIMFLGIYILLT